MKKKILVTVACFCVLILFIVYTSDMKNSNKSMTSDNSNADKIEEVYEDQHMDDTKEKGEKSKDTENIPGMDLSIDDDSTETREPVIHGTQISTDNALVLIEEKYGKNGSRDGETGNEKSYVFEDMQSVDGEEYYNFRYSWIVYDETGMADHISQLGNIFVSTDGSEVMFAEKTENGWNLYSPDSKTICIFTMEDEGEKEAASCLILNDDNTFTFSYDALSSYLPYGNFTLKDKKLTCRTMDEKYTYVFDVINDSTISFNEGESSEIIMSDSGYAKPKHGSIYHAEKNAEL